MVIGKVMRRTKSKVDAMLNTIVRVGNVEGGET
jgi:hypothetical protein